MTPTISTWTELFGAYIVVILALRFIFWVVDRKLREDDD